MNVPAWLDNLPDSRDKREFLDRTLGPACENCARRGGHREYVDQCGWVCRKCSAAVYKAVTAALEKRREA